MIVAGGCSFTSSDFKSWKYLDYDVSFKKWPEILADKFDTTLVNFGRCGFGNDYIVDKVVPFVLKNYKDIDLVVIGWTEATRFNFYNQWPFNPVLWLEGEDEDSDGDSVYNQLFVGKPYSFSKNIIKNVDLEPQIQRLKDQYDTIANLCDLLDIKCVFGQMLPYIDYWKIRNFNHSRRRHLETYDKSHLFIGGPFNECVQHNNIGCEIESEYIIGPLDSHPNEAGHKLIADLYMKKYEELYG